MKKFVLIFVMAVAFLGCRDFLEKYTIARPYGLYFEEEHITIFPKKSIYKIGDTISLKIAFPKHLEDEYGQIKELT